MTYTTTYYSVEVADTKYKVTQVIVGSSIGHCISASNCKAFVGVRHGTTLKYNVYIEALFVRRGTVLKCPSQ